CNLCLRISQSFRDWRRLDRTFFQVSWNISINQPGFHNDASRLHINKFWRYVWLCKNRFREIQADLALVYIKRCNQLNILDRISANRGMPCSLQLVARTKCLNQNARYVSNADERHTDLLWLTFAPTLRLFL